MSTALRNGHSFAPMSEHLWRAADGSRLAVYDWKAVAPRGTALLVHGLGEHALRYNHVAAWFVSQGYAVRAKTPRIVAFSSVTGVLLSLRCGSAVRSAKRQAE